MKYVYLFVIIVVASSTIWPESENMKSLFISVSKESVRGKWTYSDWSMVSAVNVYDSDFEYSSAYNIKAGISLQSISEYAPEQTYGIVSIVLGNINRASINGYSEEKVPFTMLMMGVMSRYGKGTISFGISAYTGPLFYESPASPLDMFSTKERGVEKTEGMGYGGDCDIDIKMGTYVSLYAECTFRYFNNGNSWAEGPMFKGFGYGYGIRLFF